MNSHLPFMQSHLNGCKYREVQCTQCGQYVQSHILSTHEEEDCPMRPETCIHCRKDIPYQQMEVRIYIIYIAT